MSRILSFQLTRNENLVLVLLVAVREDIRSLERLREEAEDVIDDKNRLGRGARAGHVRLEPVEGGLPTVHQ